MGTELTGERLFVGAAGDGDDSQAHLGRVLDA